MISLSEHLAGAAIILPLAYYGLYELVNHFWKLHEDALVIPTFLALCVPLFLSILATPAQFITGLGPFHVSVMWVTKLFLTLLAPSTITVFCLRLKSC